MLTEDGHIHTLDLVLPARTSIPRLLARMDRGEFPRPLEDWKQIFSASLETEIFDPYPVTGLGATLWEMVHFKGRRKQ